MTELPQHLQDQVKAASTEADSTFAQTIIAMVLTDRLAGPPRSVDEERVKVLVSKCVPCGHLKAPQPCYAVLGLKRLVCGECLHSTVVTLKETLDQNCDVCGEFVPSNIFSEFTIKRGPLLIFGNRGPCCMDL